MVQDGDQLSKPAVDAGEERASRGVVLMDGARLRRTLTRIAHEIAEQTPDWSRVAFVGIQRRGAELAERLASLTAEFNPYEPVTGSIDITFYRDDIDTRKSTRAYEQPVVRSSRIPFDVNGATIVLVDDVLQTGRTIRAAIEALFDYGRPATVRLAVLVDRGHRELPIRPDFVGKNVPTARSENIVVHLLETDGVDEVLLEKPARQSTAFPARARVRLRAGQSRLCCRYPLGCSSGSCVV